MTPHPHIQRSAWNCCHYPAEMNCSCDRCMAKWIRQSHFLLFISLSCSDGERGKGKSPSQIDAGVCFVCYSGCKDTGVKLCSWTALDIEFRSQQKWKLKVYDNMRTAVYSLSRLVGYCFQPYNAEINLTHNQPRSSFLSCALLDVATTALLPLDRSCCIIIRYTVVSF